MKIEFENYAFKLNGEKKFILAGEVQYFRLKKEKWSKMIKILKEANCNAVSTYIPWNWHEYKKGEYDFTGMKHPSRDLIYFLELIKKEKLYLIAKPGPHIHAEFLNGGVPLWLINEHPEILSLDYKGDYTSNYAFYPPITYLHPVYMKYVNYWLKEVLKILLKYDNIILYQVDNEISYNISFFGYNKGEAFTGDYNKFLIKNGLYQKFLREKYKKIEFLNKRYNERNKDFNSVKPPIEEPKNYFQQNKVLDWIDFREYLVIKYISSLIQIFAKNGCNGPFLINDPLLGYFSSWRKIYKELSKLKYPVIISYTQYQGTVLEENVSNQILKIEYLRSSKTQVIFNSEIQACDAYFLSHRTQDISDYKLLWKIAIAAGATSLTYYWFTDGENFESYEHFLPELNINSPVDKNGNKRFHFNIIKKFNKYLMKNSKFLNFKPIFDFTLGYYHRYAQFSKFNNLNNINFDIITSNGFAGSFADLLTACNFKFKLLEIEDEFNINEIGEKLIFVSYKILSEKIQKKFLNYVKNGGNLILIKNVPTMDEDYKECRILYNALNINNIKTINKPKGVFEVEKVKFKDYLLPIYDDIETYEFSNLENIEPNLWTFRDNRICGFSKKIGKGKISVIGFTPKLFMQESRKFICDYFEKKDYYQKVLIFPKVNGNKKLYAIVNLNETPQKIKIENKKIKVPPRDVIWIFKK